MWSSVASGQYTSRSIVSSSRSRPRQYRRTQSLIASRSASCAAMATTEFLVISIPFLRLDDSHGRYCPYCTRNPYGQSATPREVGRSVALFGVHHAGGNQRSPPRKRSATAATADHDSDVSRHATTISGQLSKGGHGPGMRSIPDRQATYGRPSPTHPLRQPSKVPTSLAASAHNTALAHRD